MRSESNIDDMLDMLMVAGLALMLGALAVKWAFRGGRDDGGGRLAPPIRPVPIDGEDLPLPPRLEPETARHIESILGGSLAAE